MRLLLYVPKLPISLKPSPLREGSHKAGLHEESNDERKHETQVSEVLYCSLTASADELYQIGEASKRTNQGQSNRDHDRNM